MASTDLSYTPPNAFPITKHNLPLYSMAVWVDTG